MLPLLRASGVQNAQNSNYTRARRPILFLVMHARLGYYLRFYRTFTKYAKAPHRRGTFSKVAAPTRFHRTSPGGACSYAGAKAHTRPWQLSFSSYRESTPLPQTICKNAFLNPLQKINNILLLRNTLFTKCQNARFGNALKTLPTTFPPRLDPFWISFKRSGRFYYPVFG